MIYICRKWREPKTEKMVQAENEDTAPDEYAAQHLERAEGAVCFVEVYRALLDRWVLWRVETLAATRSPHRHCKFIVHSLILETRRVTEAEVLAEFGRRGFTPPPSPPAVPAMA